MQPKAAIVLTELHLVIAELFFPATVTTMIR
jgi:hypothetical protein